MELLYLICIIVVAALLVALLFILRPFFSDHPSITVSTTRAKIFGELALGLLVLFLPLFLVTSFFSKGFDKATHILVIGFKFWSTVSWPLGIFFVFCFVATCVFAVVIPLYAIMSFASYRQDFLRDRISSKNNAEVTPEISLTADRLKSIFLDCSRLLKVKIPVDFVPMAGSLEGIPGVSGCGVIGSGPRKAVFLLDYNFILSFKEEKLKDEEVRAIFFHELSHVLHGDHFLPFLAKWISQSGLLFFSPLASTLFFWWLGLSLASRTGSTSYLAGTWFMWFVVSPFGCFLLAFLFRDLISVPLRDREFLADGKALVYVKKETLVNTIKKAISLFPVERTTFTQIGFLSKLPKQAHNLKEKDSYLTVAWKTLRDIFRFWQKLLFSKPEFSPFFDERIVALTSKPFRIVEKRKSLDFSQSTKTVLESSVFGFAVLFGIFALISFLPKEFSTSLTPFLVLSLVLVPLVGVIFTVYPLSLLDVSSFWENLFGSSKFSLTKFLKHSIRNRLWSRIHLNNFFSSLIACLFVFLLGFTPLRTDRVVLVYRYFFFHLLLLHFFTCTMLSLLMLFFYSRGKKDRGIAVSQEPGVPIEKSQYFSDKR